MNILEARRRLLEGGVKKRTAEGNPIVVRSLARMYPRLNIYGKSTQDGTPSPENPVPIVSAGDEGEINVEVSDAGINLLFNTGENKDYNSVLRNWSYGVQNSAIATVIGNQAHYTVPETGANPNTGFGCDLSRFDEFNTVYFKRGQKYVWSCDAKGVSSPGQSSYIKVFYTNINGSEWVSTGDKLVQLTEDWQRYSCEFTVPNDFDENVNRISLNFSIGTDVIAYLDIKNLKLERGTVATKWTPAPTDGDPLNYQSMTFSTPNGLPGIPVSSDGNYTDENGQQWISDEIDLARGKYVQRVKKFVVTSDTYVSSMNPYATAALDVIQPFRVAEYNGQIIKSSAMMAKNFVVKQMWNTAEEAAYTVEQTIDFNILNERIGTSAESTSEEAAVAVREWLKDNPLTFLCQLITPIETDLPAEEIAAYKALHTYSPATTVSNDAGAWMEVGYKTKKSLEVTT